MNVRVNSSSKVMVTDDQIISQQYPAIASETINTVIHPMNAGSGAADSRRGAQKHSLQVNIRPPSSASCKKADNGNQFSKLEDTQMMAVISSAASPIKSSSNNDSKVLNNITLAGIVTPLSEERGSSFAIHPEAMEKKPFLSKYSTMKIEIDKASEYRD